MSRAPRPLAPAPLTKYLSDQVYQLDDADIAPHDADQVYLASEVEARETWWQHHVATLTAELEEYKNLCLDLQHDRWQAVRAAGVSPPAMDRYRKILTAMKTTAADLRDPETNGGDANTQAAEVLLGFRRELADIIHPDLAPLFAKTAVRAGVALPDPPQEPT